MISTGNATTPLEAIETLLEGADEETLFAVAELVRRAFVGRGALPARASEWDAELAELQRRQAANRAKAAETAASVDATRRERAKGDAIAFTRRFAGEGWTPGLCATCRAPVPGWDDGLDGGAFTYGVKHLCESCRAAAKAADEERTAEAQRDEARRSRERRLRKATDSLPVGFGDLGVMAIRGAGRVSNPAAIGEAWSLVLERRANDPPTVLLVGLTGQGKTTLALALATEVIRLGSSLNATAQAVDRAAGVRFYLAANLSRARERAKLGAEAADIEEALNASLLVIDELGGEAPRLQDVIEEIVTARSAEHRLTIITTGLSPDQLVERYTGGFCRKIAHDPRCAVVLNCGVKR